MKQIESSPKLVDFSKLPNNLTPLYALPVIEAGTAVTQSLSSYVVTLASRHRLSLRTLLKFVADYCRNEDILAPTIKYIETTRLDTGGPYAALVVNALQSLTDISISGCCWLKLKNALAGNFQGIVRASRQWCIQCYRESREKFGIVYEPLIWSYPGATTCPLHKTKYENTCISCGQLQPNIGGQLDHWYCNYCKKELVGVDSHSRLSVSAQTIAWNLWLHRELGVLVSALWEPTFVPDSLNFKRFISLLARDDPHGYKGLSKRTGIDENNLHQWVRKGPPTFKLFINFCASLGVSPRTVLNTPSDAINEIGQWPAPMPPEPHQKRLKITMNDWPRIRHQMRQMLSKEVPIPTEHEICRLLGVAQGTLRCREPALLKQLTVQRARQKAHARNIARSNLVSLGKRIFKEMQCENHHLTRRTFERALIGHSGCGYKTARAIYTQLYRRW